MSSDNRTIEENAWLEAGLVKLIRKAERKKIPDDAIVLALSNIMDSIESSANSILNTLKIMRGESDLDGEEDPAYG